MLISRCTSKYYVVIIGGSTWRPDVELTPVCVCVAAGKQTQCVYHGLTMFDLAVWSPSPCVMCLCSEGRVVCDEMTCPTMHCPSPATPVGRCCPVCMEPGRNTTCETPWRSIRRRRDDSTMLLNLQSSSLRPRHAASCFHHG